MKKRDYVDELKMLEVEKEIYNNRGELDRILDKGKNLQSLEDLSASERENLESESFKLHPDKLIDNLKHRSDYAEDSYIDSVITASVDNHIKELWIANPKWSKQQLIEKLIQDNPENKNKILSIVTKTMNEQLNYLKHKFSDKDFNKIKKVLEREDLKELESLSENRTEDQIRTLVTVNKSHVSFLNEIKTKASQTSFDTKHLDDTMNLFE